MSALKKQSSSFKSIIIIKMAKKRSIQSRGSRGFNKKEKLLRQPQNSKDKYLVSYQPLSWLDMKVVKFIVLRFLKLACPHYRYYQYHDKNDKLRAQREIYRLICLIRVHTLRKDAIWEAFKKQFIDSLAQIEMKQLNDPSDKGLALETYQRMIKVVDSIEKYLPTKQYGQILKELNSFKRRKNHRYNRKFFTGISRHYSKY